MAGCSKSLFQVTSHCVAFTSDAGLRVVSIEMLAEPSIRGCLIQAARGERVGQYLSRLWIQRQCRYMSVTASSGA